MPYFPQVDASVILHDECFTPPTSTTVPQGVIGWLVSNSGSGAAINGLAAPDANTIGVWRLTTGTTTTGLASMFTTTTAIRFGGGAYTLAIRFQFPALLDGTETGSFYLGFGDNAGAPVDGAYLYWDNTQTNFRYRTRNNSTETNTDSGLAPVAATWYKLEIAVNAGGTSVTFTINGANSQSNTTNIPTTAGRETGMIAVMQKSAGTTARELYIDYIRLAIAMTSRT